MEKDFGNGKRALHKMAEEGNIYVVRMLLDMRDEIDRTDSSLQTPLHYACIKGHLEIIQFLIERGAKVSSSDKHGGTPFLIACTNGHLSVAQLLFAKGADVNSGVALCLQKQSSSDCPVTHSEWGRRSSC